ncbi:MAG: glucose-6-phosphate isomerase [Clostridia bacterium]|nr:glucose-6-phosphate isomerase [Clostridia bacterium]
MNNVKIDYNNMMTSIIGEQQGISDGDIANLMPQLKTAFKNVQNGRGKGWEGWMDLPYNQDEIADDIIATANSVRSWAESFVVLGIGGSALGPIAVFQALCHLHHNELPKEKRNAPKFYVEDNVDPERMAALFDVIDLKTTCFNIITKSGATSETMAQYLIILDALKKQGLDVSKHIIATTDHSKGNLIKIAREYNLKTFYIEDGVGGRFSELCPVGLLPAAVLGIDIKEMLRGAAAMDKACAKFDLAENPALICAALKFIAMERGKNVSVMMPYADSLKYIADWYCQIWAESLGKNVHKDGSPAFVGQTPVKSLGVTDQHSQVQLYTEGPFDKVITFIAIEKFRTTTPIPHGAEDIPDVSFLGGHTMNELITAECQATAYAITKAKKLNYTITLSELNENTLGQLLYLFEMETAFVGELLEIDTYNQPGVEEGKKATYALLGKAGYDDKREELKNAPAKSEKYIVG